MKYLKIKDGKGFFIDGNKKEQEIHSINKEDLLRLMGIVLDSGEEFEMDEIKDDNIQNEAHKIIYKALYEKFEKLLDSRDSFYDEIDNLYKDAFEKYGKDSENV